MSTTPTPTPTPASTNPKILSIAGGVLFTLGLLSLALVWASGEPSVQSVRLAAGTAVLVGMGYPAMLHASLIKRVADLEQRLAERDRGA